MEGEIRNKAFILTIFTASLCFFVGLSLALAAPPGSPYNPGETLNPSCAPTDANCTVVTPAVGNGTSTQIVFWTSSSTISSNPNFTFTTSSLTFAVIGTSTFTGVTTIGTSTVKSANLNVYGIQNQANNLFAVASSGNQIYFSVSALGVASSSEFRSPSSTIGTLLDFQGNKYSTSTGLTVQALPSSTAWVDTQVLFGQLGGGATSSLLISFTSSTGVLVLNTTTTIANASTTSNVTIGGTLQANAGQSTFASVSSTNLFGSGYLNFVSGRADLQVVSSTSNVTIGGSFQSNAGQTTLGSVSSTNHTVTGYLTVTGVSTLASASTTGNVTIGGTLQSNAGQSTFASVSSTNLFGSGYLNFVSGRADLQVVSSTSNVTIGGSFQSNAGQTTLASVSSTNAYHAGYLFVQGNTNQTANLFTLASSTNQLFFTVSPMGLASSSQFRSPSSTVGTLTVVNSLLDFNGNKYSTSSDTFLGRGIDTQVLFGQLGGGATSSNLFTFVSSTGALTLNTTTSIANVSTTGNVTIGGTFQSNAGQSTFASVSSTNLFGSGYLNFVSGRADLQVVSSTSNVTIGGTLQSNAGQSTFASVSSTNLFGSGYLNFVSGRADLQVVSSTSNVTIGGSFQSNAGQSTFESVSSTNLFLSGYINEVSGLANFGAVSSTNLFASGYLTVTGSSTLAGNVSTTNNITIGGTFQAVGTSTFQGRVVFASSTGVFGATTTLTVCAFSNCTFPNDASATNAVAYFASTGGTTAQNSIVARGKIAAGDNDIGEYVAVVGDESQYQAGDLLSVSVSNPGKFEKSSTAYDLGLAGVVTETAGLIAGGGDDHGNIVIALQGRVPVKVTGANGPIAVGDYLTSSNILGYAQKATGPGRVVAIAMKAFNGTSAADKGKILAFIDKHYYPGTGGAGLLAGVGVQSIQGGTPSSDINNQTTDPNMMYSFSNLKVQNLTVGSADKPAGFTIYDTATKQPYCISMENGILKSSPGVCGAPSPSPSVAQLSNETTTTTDASSGTTSLPSGAQLSNETTTNPLDVSSGTIPSVPSNPPDQTASSSPTLDPNSTPPPAGQ